MGVPPTRPSGGITTRPDRPIATLLASENFPAPVSAGVSRAAWWWTGGRLRLTRATIWSEALSAPRDIAHASRAVSAGSPLASTGARRSRRTTARHLSAGLPIELDLALDVSLVGDEPLAQKANRLYPLARVTQAPTDRRSLESQARDLAQVTGNRHHLRRSERGDRRELRRATGQRVDPTEIARLLRETVIRPECLDHLN